MNLHLADELAVVVGAARGIGRAIAEAFAAEGACVALFDCDERVHDVAAEVASRSGAATRSVVADVAQESSLRQGADAIERELGPVRHVVLAAGVGSGKFGFPFWRLTPADWPRVLEVNLIGAVNTAHVFGPRLAEQRRGTMLLLSSVAGQIGSQTDPPYSAAKAGVINFAQCAARDLAPLGVRVNVICPGMVRTELNESVYLAWRRQQPTENQLSYEQWAQEKIARVTPLGRWQEPEDIAALAVFLASSRARNITGQTINVDGGQVMRS